jgi:hypothetical protein
MAILPLPGRPLRIVGAFTAVLLVAIAVGSLWRPDLLWSPGDLQEAHASVGRCAACHAPFEGVRAAQCTACHTGEDFAARQAHGIGAFHQALVAKGRRCLDCHTEHRGRHAPITIGRSGNPHGDVIFELTGTASCTVCHAFGSAAETAPILLETDEVRMVRAQGGGWHRPGAFTDCASCHRPQKGGRR